MLNLTDRAVSAFLVMFTFAATAQAESRAVQFSVAPGASYSTYNGVMPSLKVGVGLSVSDHYQIVADLASQWSQNLGNAANVELGAIYNQETDVRFGGFFGLGAGWTRTFPTFQSSESAYLYARGGYRWLIVESIGLSYSPYLGGRIGREARTELEVQPLNFTFTF
jgi:hypothetical protein